MRGWRTPRRTSAPWSPMKSNNKGPQMSRMGQGALGPEGKRAADVQSEAPPPPPATESGSLRSTDKRRVTVLPKRGFRRHKDVRARCTRGTDDPGTSSPLVRMGGLTLQSERESLHG